MGNSFFLTQIALYLCSEQYFGRCFYKKSYEDKLIFLFAHRGTQFNEMGNISADLDIASQIKPDILKY